MKTAMSATEASLGTQADAFAADKAALQQDLKNLAQQLNAAESGREEMAVEQDTWKAKCIKVQQV